MSDTHIRIRPLPSDSPAYSELKSNCIQGNGDNLYLTLMNHPELHRHRLNLGLYRQNASSLPEVDRELIILRLSWLCRCTYIWGRHVKQAKKFGLICTDIGHVRKGGISTYWGKQYSLLLRAVDELYGNDWVSDVTWDELEQKYSQKQVMDLVFTVGGYRMLAMACNSFGIEPEEGYEPLPDCAEK